MASKDKLISFDFRFGQPGHIPSSRNKDKSEVFSTFKRGLEKVVEERLEKENLQPSAGNVFVFIAQLFQSEGRYSNVGVDNLIDTVLNIVAGRVINDDCQVSSLLITKKHHKSFDEEFYFCGIKFLSSSNDPGFLMKSGLYEAESLYKEYKKKSR